MNEIKGIHKFFSNKIQTIELDKDGIILNSNNQLFVVTPKESIQNFHPFFEIISTLFQKDNDEVYFNTVHLEVVEKTFIADIIIDSGNKIKNPSILIFDQSEHYKDVQEITQQRNEVFIKNFFESQKLIKIEDERIIKNKFLASITKDLRTPISSVAGLLGLFQKGSLTFEQNELIKTIRLSMNHLNRLVNDVLDLSKVEIGELNFDIKPFLFDDLVTNVENLYQNKFLLKGIHFKVIKPSKIPNKLLGDKHRVLQVIINLLENAYQFTNTGEVIFEIKIDNISPSKTGLNLIIKDTGIGFEADKIEQLRKSFSKAHDTTIEGSGMGLSIVKSVVKLLNGSIRFESKKDIGTVFNIFLPFELDVKKTEKPKNIQPFKKVEINKKINVLIVDDNEINQLVLMKLLVDHAGFYMDIASNGKVAVEMVQKENYDLIFMDMHMPILDGIGAITIIRGSDNKKIKKTPIIVLTAVESSDERKKCKALKVNYYVLKPFSSQELFTSIYTVLKLK
ncbi:response regulator [Flavobacterium sp.]|uniref:hybrid sensor histidine kinase/response regulator n=1 Tax=Flavobacterium sp. TaxID=239 RepID=UPI00286E295C|nr:response regulator [Flavobacterium sp.]